MTGEREDRAQNLAIAEKLSAAVIGNRDDEYRALAFKERHLVVAAMLAFSTQERDAAGEGEEYVTVTLSRDGTVTTHCAFDAGFDEMVAATDTIIKALQIRLSNRKFCPYSHGSALKSGALPTPSTDNAVLVERLEAVAYKVMRDWRLSTMGQEDEPSCGYPLVDAVSTPGTDIGTGEEELREIAHFVVAALRAPSMGEG